MTNNGVKERLLEQINNDGGIFIIHIYITTQFMYSESFLRKWVKDNSVGKLGNMYYFKRNDIERLADYTNNFSKITKDLDTFKKEKEIEYFNSSKSYLSNEIEDLIVSSNNNREKELLLKFNNLPDTTTNMLENKRKLFNNGKFSSTQDLYFDSNLENYLYVSNCISINELSELKFIEQKKKSFSQNINLNIPTYHTESNEKPISSYNKKNIENKEFLTSLDVALLTEYTVPTINKWAKHYGLKKDTNGNYIWSQTDLRNFKTTKFWFKDSYHKHLDNVRKGYYWTGSKEDWTKLVFIWIVIIFIILLFCCSMI